MKKVVKVLFLLVLMSVCIFAFSTKVKAADEFDYGGYEELPDELREKASKCKDAEELLSLAQEEGIDLTDEQIDAISGGRSEWVADAFYI